MKNIRDNTISTQRPGFIWLHSATNQLAYWMQHEPCADTYGDVECESHQRDDGEGGNRFGVVGKVNVRDWRQHEQPHKYERGTIGLRRNGGHKRREEQGQEETSCL